MPRYIVFGNSGSGKTTLAARLAPTQSSGAMHLDLDTLAWEPTPPPRRRAEDESTREIDAFLEAHADWVIEGCYADLLAHALARCISSRRATRPESPLKLVFLRPGTEACIQNARARPWEPHKYESPDAQNANLEMLIEWIRAYETRRDVFSLSAHRALMDGFAGDKIELTSRAAIGAFAG